MEPRVAVVVIVFNLLMFPVPIEPRPDGAPTSTCSSMTPGHGIESTATVPYQITLSATTYKAGGSITVTVSGDSFQGILMQVRPAGGGSSVGYGTWTNVATDTKKLQCTKADDSVTHSNPNLKQNAVFTWTAPQGVTHDLQVIATLCKEQFTWWKDVKSDTLSHSAASPTIEPPLHCILMVTGIALLVLKMHSG